MGSEARPPRPVEEAAARRKDGGGGCIVPDVLAGACHCGAVRVVLPRRPRSLTACNCSICRRYGALWAYYPARAVRIERAPGATAEYLWGERSIRFVRCALCGCVTHWEAARRPRAGRMGVNARLFDPGAIGEVRIRRPDNARTGRVRV